MFGIALGVAALITVLSVMNGFDEQIRNRFFAIAPQVTIISSGDIHSSWPGLANTIKHLTSVKGISPFVSGQGMLINQNSMHGVNVLGILPTEEAYTSAIAQQVVSGNLNNLNSGSFHLALGKTLAEKLKVNVGDGINLFTAQTITTPLGLLPRYRRFMVSAIFSSAGNFGFEQGLVYIHLDDAQKLFLPGHYYSGLHIKLTDLYQASQVSQALHSLLPKQYVISNWIEEAGSFFQTLAINKNMLFFILILIIAIAAFNLISALNMGVNEKRADIAILRTLGATPFAIMSTFVFQGTLIGFIGTFFGLIGGLVLAWNVTAVGNALQHALHVQLIPASVYFVDYLPSKIIISDLLQVCGIAICLSILSTIYPASVAFCTSPAKALRYD